VSSSRFVLERDLNRIKVRRNDPRRRAGALHLGNQTKCISALVQGCCKRAEIIPLKGGRPEMLSTGEDTRDLPLLDCENLL
jgi:hypothetical protein